MKLYTLDEMANLLSLTKTAVYNQIHCGNSGITIPPHVKMGKHIRFRHNDYDKWVNELAA